MPEPLVATLYYLVKLIFGLYTAIVILRLFLQKYGAPFYNPIVKAIVLVTKPLVNPLRAIVPGVNGWDLAVVVLLLAIELIKVAAIVGLTLGTFPDIGGWVLWAIAAGLSDISELFFWAIILGAILSWIPSLQRSPVAEVVYTLTQPFLSVFQRFIPPLAGIDFSPLVAIVVIRVFTMLLLTPMLNAAVGLALS